MMFGVVFLLELTVVRVPLQLAVFAPDAASGRSRRKKRLIARHLCYVWPGEGGRCSCRAT